MSQITQDPSFSDSAGKLMEKQYATIGPVLVSRARALCPVDTGMLRESIGWGVLAGALVVGATEEYAPVIEFGTSRRAAQPFLRPAVESLRTKPPPLRG